MNSLGEPASQIAVLFARILFQQHAIGQPERTSNHDIGNSQFITDKVILISDDLVKVCNGRVDLCNRLLLNLFVIFGKPDEGKEPSDDRWKQLSVISGQVLLNQATLDRAVTSKEFRLEGCGIVNDGIALIDGYTVGSFQGGNVAKGKL